MAQIEEQTNLNFAIPTSLSLKIDKLLIDLKERGSVKIKTKPDLLHELLLTGYGVSLKTLNNDIADEKPDK
jgi:hypothetical protein